jgi:cell division protein FtsN
MTQHKSDQKGGTLLGFIIGVVVGLGVALAVAVYITKVPIPAFLNKGQTRTVDQDAAEAQKNKNWDPNAPLYGKNPAKPVAPSPAPADAPAAAAAPGPAPAPAPVAAPVAAPAPAANPVAKVEVRPAVSADPLGDLARARAGAEPFNYFVQVGAFRTSDDAESQRAKLTLSGVEAKVTEREQSGRMVYRVRVGPFERKEEAEKSKSKMDAAGIETALVRVQR